MGVNSKDDLGLRRAVFLDRDGTLIEYEEEPVRKDQIRLFHRSGDAVRKLNDLGFLVLVVTNQPIVEKGILTLEEANSLSKFMVDELALVGARIDKVYMCPHKYGSQCRCRKPNLGMIEDAVADFKIDMAGSWIVGDTRRDMETGKRANLRTVLVMTGEGGKDTEFFSTVGEFEASDILGAAEIIERESAA